MRMCTEGIHLDALFHKSGMEEYSFEKEALSPSCKALLLPLILF